MIALYLPGLAFVHWLAGATLGALSVLSVKAIDGMRGERGRKPYDDRAGET